MKRYSTKVLLLILVGLTACNFTQKSGKESRVESLPYYTDPSFTPHWPNGNKDAIAGMHRIPRFTLLNQLGDTITEKSVQHKIYVADFFFTSCPGICPKMTSNMALVQEEFINDEEVMLLSHTVTPEYDSVPVLKRYAEAKGVIAKKWQLVTGERKTIYELGRMGYFVEEDLGEPAGENDFLHTENFILIDKNRHIRGIYDGLNKTAIAQLIADIKTLKKEG
jgi:protein SCO1/2